MTPVRKITFAVTCCLAAMAMSPSRAEPAAPLSGEMKKLDGSTVNLADYKGKVVLVVNVASRCGYTKQYKGLQQLHDTYKDKGLVVLGVPANDFGAQEPGSDAEIATFCSANYGVTFDMLSKVSVKGPGKVPLYAALTESVDPKGEVSWNFEKFLIGRDGKVLGRFKSGVAPEDAALVKAIEAALAR